MKNVIKFLGVILLMTTASCSSNQLSERKEKFDFNWKFSLADHSEAHRLDFDDADWRQLDIPHDYSIEQPFNRHNPSGKEGGYAYGGIGWYRKHFVLKNTPEQKVHILFDGIYRNSEVWINGHSLGFWPYGYSSFYYDLTPHLNPPGQENVLAVKTDTTEQPNSRWYTGAGIYRHAWLITTNKMYIDHWGVFAKTTEATQDKANIEIDIDLVNEYKMDKNCKVTTSFINHSGKKVEITESNVKILSQNTVNLQQTLRVDNPTLWSIENPYLYQLQVEVQSSGKTLDTYTIPFGIRTFRFDPNRGFFLNEKHVKLKGTNNHHDGGPLGAACLDYTHERQLKILKEMGCNALRISHNPPAPELLDAADRLGFVVINEIFDEWSQGKTSAGYTPHFNEWYERDISNWIRRDRNHPSIVAWSLGNEVPEQANNKNGPNVLKKLILAAKKYDTTRPFTAGCQHVRAINKNGFGQLLDIVGYNYRESFYKQDHKKFANRIIYGSETAKYPYQPGKNCDHLHTYEQWVTGQTEDFIAGDFIWTGFDCLGEAGIGEGGTGCKPWDHWPKWPWRGAICGMIDICGFQKPGYWFRRALWTDEPIVYIAVETDPSAKNTRIQPFWGWPKVQAHWNHDVKGQPLAVHVYTNVHNVELFLNGKSLGAKQWNLSKEAFLIWNVPYEPGTLEAIGSLPDGSNVSCKVQTAGQPAKIRLTADRKPLTANRQDLMYVKAEVLDENEVPVPFADNLIEFEVAGPGILNAVGNGDQISHTPFKGTKIETFQGKCLAIVQSTEQKGKITVTAKSQELPNAVIEFNAK